MKNPKTYGYGPFLMKLALTAAIAIFLYLYLDTDRIVLMVVLIGSLQSIVTQYIVTVHADRVEIMHVLLRRKKVYPIDASTRVELDKGKFLFFASNVPTLILEQQDRAYNIQLRGLNMQADNIADHIRQNIDNMRG